MKIYDLPVMGYERAKSFYGKAKIIETDNGEKSFTVLQYFCLPHHGGGAVRSYVGRLFCYHNAPCK